MIECCLLPPGSWMGKEMKSGMHEGKTRTSRGGETVHQAIISGPVYLPKWSISQATDKSLMSRLHSGLCWMRNIYSTIRLYALDYVPWLCWGKRRGTVLCIAWLSWNENEASRLSTSLLLGSLVERERESESARSFHFKGSNLKATLTA